jgi:hypothetical protein
LSALEPNVLTVQAIEEGEDVVLIERRWTGGAVARRASRR